MLNGSAPAEQNHSSVVAHLGKGANWGVAEHLSHMLQRKIHLTRLCQEKGNSQFVLTHRYKSKLGINDETAKKSLSTFAYDQLFTQEFHKSKKLQHLALNDGTINV
jgi:hydrogenase maturation factor